MAAQNQIKIALLLLLLVVIGSIVRGDGCDESYMLHNDGEGDNPSSPSAVLSAEAINGILKAHNDARREMFPEAKYMPMLKWNQQLANFAQNFVSQCFGNVHSSANIRRNVPGIEFEFIGENIAAGANDTFLAETGGQASTMVWLSQRAHWRYPFECDDKCESYLQVIWAGSTDIGCGYMRCESLPTKNYWSCNYGPAGGIDGQPPYQPRTQLCAAQCPDKPPFSAADAAIAYQGDILGTHKRHIVILSGDAWGTLLSTMEHSTLRIAAESDISSTLKVPQCALTVHRMLYSSNEGLFVEYFFEGAVLQVTDIDAAVATSNFTDVSEIYMALTQTNDKVSVVDAYPLVASKHEKCDGKCYAWIILGGLALLNVCGLLVAGASGRLSRQSQAQMTAPPA